MTEVAQDLRDLYQEVILEHGRRPRNHRRLDSATHHARGDNPMCGDRLELFLALADDHILDAAFQARGCAISIASGSLMTEAVRGRSRAEAKALASAFGTLAKTGACPECDAALAEPLGQLSALSGVHEFPSRVKCATLAWQTLNTALDGGTEASSE
jgi:nitrogen fixation NifU-like protein